MPAGTRKELKAGTPLFLYLMIEASLKNKGKRLGPAGSAILMEVFGGILRFCDSFLYERGKKRDWSPDPCIKGRRDLTLADLITYGGSR